MESAKALPGRARRRNDGAMRHALFLIVMLSACAGDETEPRLWPTDAVLAEPALPAHAAIVRADPAAVEDSTRARAEALRARAEALRGPVVDPGLLARGAATAPATR